MKPVLSWSTTEPKRLYCKLDHYKVHNYVTLIPHTSMISKVKRLVWVNRMRKIANFKLGYVSRRERCILAGTLGQGKLKIVSHRLKRIKNLDLHILHSSSSSMWGMYDIYEPSNCRAYSRVCGSVEECRIQQSEISASWQFTVIYASILLMRWQKHCSSFCFQAQNLPPILLFYTTQGYSTTLFMEHC